MKRRRTWRARAVGRCGLVLGSIAWWGCAPPAPPAGQPHPAPAGPAESDFVAVGGARPVPVGGARRGAWWWELGPSFLPNLGLEAGVGRILSRDANRTHSVDVHGAWQFLDDEDVAEDGHPKAGPWAQLRVGVRRSSSPDGWRHVVARFGGLWVRAGDDPNVIQEAGDYLGLYGGIGFQTDLTPTLSVGPELAVLALTRTTGFPPARPVPQVNWHVRVHPGGADRNDGRADGPLPRGELYGGMAAVVSPGVGGGFLLGQVFHRRASAVWSVEVSAAVQPPQARLLFEEGGRWAQVHVGVRAAFPSGERGRWTGRGGVVWLRSTARNSFLDVRSDHIGGRLAGGYEHDLADWLATGPEVNLMIVGREQDVAFRLVPQLWWHLIWRP